MYVSKRNSGRTTRMIDEALRLSREGRAVYVIMDNMERARYHQRKLDHEYPYSGVKFETPSSPGNFDWGSLRLIGAHPNCVVLVDHFAIERKFGAILDELYRYD